MYLTIFYRRGTGEITTVLRNKYVSHKKQIAQLTGLSDTSNIGFIYLADYEELDPSEYLVKMTSPGTPGQLISKSGNSLQKEAARKKALTLIKTLNIIPVEFEGGTGDYCLQADVVHLLARSNPSKKFFVLANPTRHELIARIVDAPNVTYRNPSHEAALPKKTINFSDINTLGYFNPPHGKVATYAYIAGLPEEVPLVQIKLCDKDVRWADEELAKNKVSQDQKLIAFHRRSGEPNAKTWPWELARDFMTKALSQYQWQIILFGGHGEEPPPDPAIIDGLGHYSWMQVAALLSRCDLVVAIDSAVLHIAYHLGQKVISLWGPTSPDYILPRSLEITALEGSCDRRPCMSYICRKISCMGHITVDRVLESCYYALETTKEDYETQLRLREGLQERVY